MLPYEWDGHVLMCNTTTWVPNDLHFHGWHLGNSLRAISGMDPHLLLHLLLPPLLFESAFAIDWHIFYKLSGYALVLALPGLLVATGLTGLVYSGLYGWPWEACILIGGILSATDPVAVVALLREMGVKKSLATLIEAEGLLAIAAYLGRDVLAPELLRRNILTRGINLLALKGKTFRIGGAVLAYSGECHPCSQMETLLGPGGYNAVRGHGGVTARILESGEIRTGDAVTVL